MMEPQVVINKTERANSYEFGKAGARFKVYFDSMDELRLKIKECADADAYRRKLEGDFDE